MSTLFKELEKLHDQTKQTIKRHKEKGKSGTTTIEEKAAAAIVVTELSQFQGSIRKLLGRERKGKNRSSTSGTGEGHP